MILRPATLQDEKFLFDLRNEPHVRAMSWKKTPISVTTHHRWLVAALKENLSRRIFIAEEHELTHHEISLTVIKHDVIPFGTGRLHRDGRDVEFSIALCPEFRGKGLARELVAALIPYAAEMGSQGIAKVSSENLPSLLAFLKNGFKPWSMQFAGPRRWVVLVRKLR